jgi:hypothetical protein
VYHIPAHTYWGRIAKIPSSGVLSEKIIAAELVNKLPTFYGTRRIITVLTRTHHWSLFSAR